MGALLDTDPTVYPLACEQIRQLASRYAVFMNHRDLDSLVGLFVDDVRVGRQSSGREALRADFVRQLRPLGRSILQVTNHVIDVSDADHATGVVGTRGEIELDGQWVIQVIEYHDTYERRERALAVRAPPPSAVVRRSARGRPDRAPRGKLAGQRHRHGRSARGDGQLERMDEGTVMKFVVRIGVHGDTGAVGPGTPARRARLPRADGQRPPDVSEAAAVEVPGTHHTPTAARSGRRRPRGRRPG